MVVPGVPGRRNRSCPGSLDMSTALLQRGRANVEHHDSRPRTSGLLDRTENESAEVLEARGTEHNERMEITEPVTAARRVVKDRFPECRVAFLSSTVLSSRRTPTSDLDIVVIVDGPRPLFARHCEPTDGSSSSSFIRRIRCLFFTVSTHKHEPARSRKCVDTDTF